MMENDDGILQNLLAKVSNGRLSSKIPLAEVREVVLRCREQFMSEESLLRIEPPIYIVGDIHGQFEDLVEIISRIGLPPRRRYLFLGDYVDRGKFGIETVSLLMAYKIRYPNDVYMLRGNHETRAVNLVYGFFDECQRIYPNVDDGKRLWTLFQHAFNCMPFAAVIARRIFAVHGGISQDLHKWDQFSRIRRPTDVTDVGFLNDLIWSDPSNIDEEFAPSSRGVSQIFGLKATEKFQARFNIDLIVRGHQELEDIQWKAIMCRGNFEDDGSSLKN